MVAILKENPNPLQIDHLIQWQKAKESANGHPRYEWTVSNNSWARRRYVRCRYRFDQSA